MNPYFEADGIRLFHGEAAEILPALGRFELLLTDPPYGIGAGEDKPGTVGQGSRAFGVQDWDFQTQPELLAECVAACDNAIVWGGNYYPLPCSRGWFIWDKKVGPGWYSTAHFEMAWTSFNRNGIAYRQSQVEAYGKMAKQHPTQKPLGLMRWCVNEAGGTGEILDPFAGSCTTLLAAKLEGRAAVGIERCEAYCEIGAQRLRQKLLF